MKIYSEFIREKYSSKIFHSFISDTISSSTGGRKFFDSIDEYIKNDKDIINELVKGLDNEYLVSSGQFGDKIHSLYEGGEINCKGILVFNGKILTRNKGIRSYCPENFEIENKEFVFIDDSFFSGKTFLSIESYLNDNGSTIRYANVAYDGSKIKNPKINSLYRYYS